jgi:hypothetical protein
MCTYTIIHNCIHTYTFIYKYICIYIYLYTNKCIYIYIIYASNIYIYIHVIPVDFDSDYDYFGGSYYENFLRNMMRFVHAKRCIPP